MTSPIVTIFIRTKNEASYLPRCLYQIFHQRTSLPFEVIILDDHSQDSTLSIARQFPLTIIPLQHQFGYGSSLNLGVRHANGKIFVTLSAHAIPRHPHWIHLLTQPLLHNPSIAAAYGRQIVPSSCHPVEYWLHRQGFPPRDRLFTSWSPQCHLSNANAAYRTPLLRRLPFASLSYGEDAHWAKQHLSFQRKIAYVSQASVIHYHHYHLQRRWHVSLLTGKSLKDQDLPLSHSSSFNSLFQELFFGLLIHRRYWTKLAQLHLSLPRQLYWYFYWWIYTLAKQLGIYVGQL